MNIMSNKGINSWLNESTSSEDSEDDYIPPSSRKLRACKRLFETHEAGPSSEGSDEEYVPPPSKKHTLCGRLFGMKNSTNSGDYAKEKSEDYPGPSCSFEPLNKLIIYPEIDKMQDLGEGRPSVSLISTSNSAETSEQSSHELRSPSLPETFNQNETIHSQSQSEHENELIEPIVSLVPYTDSDSVEEELTPMKEKRKPRKRQTNSKMWKKNIRKENRQMGKEYISTTGKTVPPKKVKHNDCKCKFKCPEKISKDDRENLMLSFYSLVENEKKHYIIKNTECKASVRVNMSRQSPKKKNSFSYYLYLNEEKIRVCKKFFLETLLISQKTIYNVHLKKDKTTSNPKSDERGKKTRDRIPVTAKDFVRQHIESFPKAESHYCRAKTKKEYLNSELNINRLYSLYTESCKENNVQPVKISMYRTIFNNEYNLDFLVPKSDRCDLCEEFLMAKKENRASKELTFKYETHQVEKNSMREERKKDRESNEMVICFDLQNVIALPRANVSCFFYKRKLNVYNLTAHSSKDKKGYCVVWHEALCGRSGNDIASAVIKVLTAIVSDYPEIKKYILWSDSCVPQNRNSIISYALATFLTENSHIDSITMKFSTPGHSCIQEVDNIHSNIEKALKLAEVWSPVSLLRVLIGANRKSPYKVLQMNEADFLDYQTPCKMLKNYKNCPYTQVCQLKFERANLLSIKFKRSHSTVAWEEINLVNDFNTRRKRSTLKTTFTPKFRAKKVLERPKLAQAKVEDVKSMMKWMPAVDIDYYSAILK